ncbi:MAG: XRE family transcriptional regulator [Bacteroidetes bacterium]|nr:MAG: XRE family transcriptional regulator [Bacteroidota bacterium]
MNQAQHIQKHLFQHIREQIPTHLSLVDEISDLLHISADSTYRRIRGEKQLTLDELVKLCEHFQLSLDVFLRSPKDSIPFSHVKVDASNFQVDSYLDFAMERASMLSMQQDVEMIIIANDLTIFQLLQVPELAAFKLFFWQKSSLGFPDLKHTRFSLDAINSKLLEKGKAIVKEYVKVPSIEIVGIEAVNSFLRQIKYYLDLGYFERQEDAVHICDKLIELVRHFHRETDHGFKFPYNTSPLGKPGNFTMYYNELFVIDGIVLMRMGDTRMTYIGTGPLNFVHTLDRDFYESKYGWAQNLMSKSILLSGISEKERNKFFLRIEDSVRGFRDEIGK